MKRPPAATIVTLLVLAGVMTVVMMRRRPQAEAGPKEAIYAMIDAARAGDTSAYLAQYTGPMAAQLKQVVTAQYLKTSNAEIKGVALGEPNFLSARDATVRLEYVYQDRNEVQMVYLENAGGWKIARVDSAERIKTLIPYGTPVK